MKKTLLVVRGHQTHDVQGVTSVVGSSMVHLVSNLVQALTPMDILIEDSKITKDQAKTHCAEKRSVIYLGGTALLWYRLRHRMKHMVVTDHNDGAYMRYHFMDCAISTQPGQVDFMIYERNMRNNTKLVVLFGASEAGTRIAVQRYLKNAQFSGSELLIVGNAQRYCLSNQQVQFVYSK